MMTKDQWGEFLNSLPPAEFLELLAWYDEQKQAETRKCRSCDGRGLEMRCVEVDCPDCNGTGKAAAKESGNVEAS